MNIGVTTVKQSIVLQDFIGRASAFLITIYFFFFHFSPQAQAVSYK